jgi:hypothetical protein
MPKKTVDRKKYTLRFRIGALWGWCLEQIQFFYFSCHGLILFRSFFISTTSQFGQFCYCPLPVFYCSGGNSRRKRLIRRGKKPVVFSMTGLLDRSSYENYLQELSCAVLIFPDSSYLTLGVFCDHKQYACKLYSGEKLFSEMKRLEVR